MAVCYLMLPYESASLDTGTVSWNGSVSSSSHTAITKTATKSVTTPNNVGAFTGAWMYFSWSISSVIHHTTVSGSGSTKATYTGYDSGYQGWNANQYYAITTPAAGTSVSVTYRLYVGSASYDTSKSYADYRYYGTWNAWLCLGVNLPSISDVMYASEINRLANIFNITGVTAGAAIARARPQAIGQYLNAHVFNTWNKTGAATNVSFNATIPYKSEINTVVSRMTNKYVYR